MQGIATLDSMNPREAFATVQKKYGRMANAVGTAYESLSPEQKKAISGVASEISSLPEDKLHVFDQLLTFLEKHASQYKDVVAELVSQDMLDEGDLPEKYDPPVFATIHAMVRTALSHIRDNPEGFARGGEVSLKQSASRVQAAGRFGDTILAHITPEEASLLKAYGGSGTINPKTGLREYGLLSGVFKSVGKILGAAAPVIGGALGSLVGMPFLGAVIGGGIGGLASGGGVKGALLGAAMGGVGSLAFSGLSSVLSNGTFMEGVNNMLPSYLGGAGESFGGTLFGSGATPAMSGTASTPTASGANPTVAPGDSNPANLGGTGMKAPAGGVAPATTSPAASTAASSSATKAGFFDSPLEWIKQNPGKAALYGGGALLAANMLGSQEKPAPPSLIASNPELTKEQREAKYPWTVVDASKFTNTYTQPTNVEPQYSWQQGVYTSPKFAATGGIMDARAGGHLHGPGTGTSDSIPARLSDGEFVMTAKAVRGAGGGDRMKGAKKMYELMHKFERTA